MSRILLFLVLIVLLGGKFANSLSLIEPIKSALKKVKIHRDSLLFDANSRFKKVRAGIALGATSIRVLGKDLSGLLSHRSINRKVRPSDVIEKDSTQKNAVLARLMSWYLTKAVRARMHHVSGLDVCVRAVSNGNVAKGKIDSIEMRFSSLAFDNFLISGGGELVVSGLQLGVGRLFFFDKQFISHPYLVHCDVKLTQDDVMNSEGIREAVQQLSDIILERALSSKGKVNIEVRKVFIRNRRLVAEGLATMLTETATSNLRGTNGSDTNSTSRKSMDFSMSATLSVRPHARNKLHLAEISVVLDPDPVLLRTFLPIPAIEVDLGTQSSIDNLEISENTITLSGSSTISPGALFPPAPAESPADMSYLEWLSLLFWTYWSTVYYHQYDLSLYLSSIMNFNGGVITAWMRRNR